MINLAALMALLNGKDKDRFEEIYHLYEKRLFAYSMKILNNASLAEEAVSETFFSFAKYYNKIYNLETPNLLAYLIIINRNASFKIYNAEKGDKNILHDQFIEDKPELSYKQDKLIDLRQMLQELPGTYRDILLLKYSYGFETAEIAHMTSHTINQINYILNKTKKLLNKEIIEE